MQMPDTIYSKLKKSLVLHEDLRKFPYVDTVGKITIGIGYNLTDRGIDDEWINTQYNKDVAYFYSELSKFDWFNHLNDDRKVVLLDMSFMGLKKLLQFKKMIAALSVQDYNKAAFEMLNSKWAHQVKNRAFTLAHAMRSGVYTLK